MTQSVKDNLCVFRGHCAYVCLHNLELWLTVIWC